MLLEFYRLSRPTQAFEARLITTCCSFSRIVGLFATTFTYGTTYTFFCPTLNEATTFEALLVTTLTPTCPRTRLDTTIIFGTTKFFCSSSRAARKATASVGLIYSLRGRSREPPLTYCCFIRTDDGEPE